jgi:uncharacterized membrane protein
VTERSARVAVAALALLGAGIAGYLTYTHYRGIAPVCTTGGCEEVQTSDYAELGGIPVAVIGLAGYLALLATAAVRGAGAAAAGVAMALGGLGFALYLVYVQLAILEAVCIWCLASDAVIALLVVVALIRVRALGATASSSGAE